MDITHLMPENNHSEYIIFCVCWWIGIKLHWGDPYDVWNWELHLDLYSMAHCGENHWIYFQFI